MLIYVMTDASAPFQELQRMLQSALLRVEASTNFLFARFRHASARVQALESRLADQERNAAKAQDCTNDRNLGPYSGLPHMLLSLCRFLFIVMITQRTMSSKFD